MALLVHSRSASGGLQWLSGSAPWCSWGALGVLAESSNGSLGALRECSWGALRVLADSSNGSLGALREC